MINSSTELENMIKRFIEKLTTYLLHNQMKNSVQKKKLLNLVKDSNLIQLQIILVGASFWHQCQTLLQHF